MLKALEDSGRIRRGYFVGGVAATQFALPAALDLLRSLREQPDEPEVLLVAATDPANPFGTLLKWPDIHERGDDRPMAHDGGQHARRQSRGSAAGGAQPSGH